MFEPENGNPQLVQMIKDKIIERGKITFKDFMQMALYESHFGYYTSGREICGKRGDYLTSPDISPVFGKLICRQIFDMWRILGEPSGFTIVEAGAGNAALSLEILKSSKKFFPEFYGSLNFIITETSPHQQDKIFFENPELESKVLRRSSFNEIKNPITGCIISNELIDAFPVHIVVNNNGTIKEVYVTSDNDRFADVLDIPSSPEIDEYLKDVSLSEGQRIEINLEAVDYIKAAAGIIDRGFIITIDYGFPQKEFYETFKNGSLLCYYKHKIIDNPYNRIGFQDITSHVNFTSLARYGKETEFEITGFTTQIYFLISLGIFEEFKAIENFSVKNMSEFEWNQKLKELIMPGGMGSQFKVLIQHKGIEKPQLKGFSCKDFENELFN